VNHQFRIRRVATGDKVSRFTATWTS